MFVGVLVIAAATRIIPLPGESVDGDELFTLAVSQDFFGGGLARVREDVVHRLCIIF